MATEMQIAWMREDSALMDEVGELWRKHDAIPEDASSESRAKQLVIVGRQDGEIAAVTTAAISMYQPLRHVFAFYRIFVFPDHRRGGWMHKIGGETFSHLQSWAAADPSRLLAGAGTVRETGFLNDGRRGSPMSPGIGAMLVGYNPSGLPIRLKWFDHVRV